VPWLAVGAPGEDVGSAVDAGAVTIFEQGLPLDRGSYYQGKADVPGTAESNDQFGSSLAAIGDALAIGAPLEDIGASHDAGNVTVLESLPGAFPDSGARYTIEQGVDGVPDKSEPNEGFGTGLAARGTTALTIGVPGQDLGSIRDAGAIIDVPMNGSAVPATMWRQGTGGIAGTAETDDFFGAYLTGTASGAVVASAWAEDVGSVPDSGVVHLLQDGPGGGLVATGNQVFHQDSPKVPGTAEENDLMGGSLSFGDHNLLVGMPGETVHGQQYAGAVVAFRVDTDGRVTFARAAVQFHQDTPGVPSAAEVVDFFGGAVGGDGRSVERRSADRRWGVRG
jgi:hypothetical protein